MIRRGDIPLGGDVLEHGLERREIGMDVGDERIAHGSRLQRWGVRFGTIGHRFHLLPWRGLAPHPLRFLAFVSRGPGARASPSGARASGRCGG